LRRSLPAIRESLDQLRELARMLEEQPESVVYWAAPAAGETAMTCAVRSAGLILATAAVAIGMGCALPRPTTVPGRMIEPQLVEPAREAPVAATPMLVRLLETQARAHIGRRLLHRQPDGELTEDPVWHWSSEPDRYSTRRCASSWRRARTCASWTSRARR
jgi:hypothetical protein